MSSETPNMASANSPTTQLALANPPNLAAPVLQATSRRKSIPSSFSAQVEVAVNPSAPIIATVGKQKRTPLPSRPQILGNTSVPTPVLAAIAKSNRTTLPANNPQVPDTFSLLVSALPAVAKPRFDIAIKTSNHTPLPSYSQVEVPSHIDLDENIDPVSDIEATDIDNDYPAEFDSDSDSEDEFTIFRRANPDFDLHPSSEKHENAPGAKKIPWSIPVGFDWSPAQLGKAQPSKWAVFRIEVLDEDKEGRAPRNELRQYPHWAYFDWNSEKQVSKLNKWRLQLRKQSGVEQNPAGKPWTKLEKDQCLRLIKAEIEKKEAKTKSQMWDKVQAGMHAFFKDVVQKVGAEMADVSKRSVASKAREGETLVDVLMEERVGMNRCAKTISNKCRSFPDIQKIVNAGYGPGENVKAKKAKTCKRGSEELAKDGEEIDATTSTKPVKKARRSAGGGVKIPKTATPKVSKVAKDAGAFKPRTLIAKKVLKSNKIDSKVDEKSSAHDDVKVEVKSDATTEIATFGEDQTPTIFKGFGFGGPGYGFDAPPPPPSTGGFTVGK